MKYALATSAVIALVAVAADSRAQQETTTVVRREIKIEPSKALVASGTITLALSYGVATIVGISTTYDKDRLLFIPLAGPWVDLGMRPQSTSEENWARVGLVVNGVAQITGLVLLVTGLVMRAHSPKPQVVTATMNGLRFSF